MTPHVLLIRPCCAHVEPEFAEPLGIERLAGYLRATGAAEVTVMDHRLYERERKAAIFEGGFWSDMYEACEQRPPAVVGLSLMTSADVPDALRIISRTREFWPEARFVAGGLYVTTQPDEARARFPRMVELLPGEGELALRAFVEGTPVPERVLDPNEWAMAYRPQLERYAALGCAVNLQTSRGCPGRCAFCATPGLPDELRCWQPRDIALVADEIEAEATRLAQAGLPAVFNFVDDDFGPLSRVEALADVLERRRLHVSFALEMRVASLVCQPGLADRLARLHRAGLTRVFFGVESLDTRTLRDWHKPYDVTALPEVLAACRAADVSVQVGYILWHRGQTVEGALAEVEAMAALGLYSHHVATSRLIVFEGCVLAADGCDERGFQPMDECSEAFYQRFCEQTSGLAQRWTEAAIAEPAAAARAFLTGDRASLAAIERTLRETNDASLAAFRQLAGEMRGRAVRPAGEERPSGEMRPSGERHPSGEMRT